MPPFWSTRNDVERRVPLFKRGDLVMHRASRTVAVVESCIHRNDGSCYYQVSRDFGLSAYADEGEIEDVNNRWAPPTF